ncbi:MAG: GNAT family N-acetyltransferase [Candidatus Bathyarchaeota archaeon]|nr:GNAT family N-acetyltransferase [Candidatus Bathyarchaeota archaeon]
MSLVVKDIQASTIDDAFRVCSFNRLEDPLQQQGMEIKRRWLLDMLNDYGPCTKIAYLRERPVAQILFYPEEAAPFILPPREGVVVLSCAYNPFPEAQGKGAASALVKSLVEEARTGLRCLRGEPCSFIAAKPFDTGAELSLGDFYARCGFSGAEGEMYMEISGKYRSRGETEYHPLPEDRGRALMFYDPMCEWGYGFAVRVRELIHDIEPELPFEMINSWERPEEFMRRGNQVLIVNAAVIQSFWTDREAFRTEVEQAIRGQ